MCLGERDRVTYFKERKMKSTTVRYTGKGIDKACVRKDNQ